MHTKYCRLKIGTVTTTRDELATRRLQFMVIIVVVNLPLEVATAAAERQVVDGGRTNADTIDVARRRLRLNAIWQRRRTLVGKLDETDATLR